MKERPILFSGQMVRAILDGRKTQMRRIVRPQPKAIELYGDMAWQWGPLETVFSSGQSATSFVKAPYLPGGHLWVRETWKTEELACGVDGIRYRADDTFRDIENNEEAANLWIIANNNRKEFPWRPSIHMPRWASRLTLEIKDVRVERLQDISEEDAKAEGVKGPGPGVVLPGPFDDGRKGEFGYSALGCGTFPTAKGALRFLWNALNSKRGYGWDVNPWVWVIEFQPEAKQP